MPRLNIGCGRMVLDGYVNVDMVLSPKAPRAPEKLGVDMRYIDQHFSEGVFDEVLALHVIEHVYRWEVEQMLLGWRRVMRPGGRLIIEAPDIVKCARNLLAGTKDQLCMWGFYGDPGHEDEFMCHRWGWTSATLAPVLTSCGFGKLRLDLPPQYHGARVNRDFRIEAYAL